MNILQNRIDSFKNSTVKWPRTGKQFPKVESFAKAGFYFVRRPKTVDSVRCFLCDVELNHWKAGQSPFARHSKESPNCAWHVLNFPDVSNKPLPVNLKNQSVQPRGSAMRAARLSTFNHHNYWPPNKGMLSKTRRYPAASKLADAGFFFSPTAEQAARIKCSYCHITIESPEKNQNMLDKHQELSKDCLFFAPTHNMRTTRSRRDTVDSAKSHDTFKTASSDLEDESMDIDHSLYEPSFTENRKSKPSNKTTVSKAVEPNSESDFEDTMKKNLQVKDKKASSTTAATTRTKNKEPIKIAKRKKPVETTASNKRKREDSIDTQKKTKENDDIWSIEQTFTPPTHVRKPALTFGIKKIRVLPSVKKTASTSIDIFGNLKPSLIVKPVEEKNKKASITGIQETEQDSNKKSSLDLPKIIDPILDECIIGRESEEAFEVVSTELNKRVSNSSSNGTTATKLSTTRASTSASESNKVSIATARTSQSAISSSTSSSKAPLKTTLCSSQISIEQKGPTTDIPLSVENVESVVKKPYRDKGKGRAFEYNIPSSMPAVKKPISLSRSKNKKNKIKDFVSSASSSLFVSAPAEPSQINSPEAPKDTVMSDLYDSTIVENFLGDLPNANTLMETTPPTEFMDRTPSPQLGLKTPSSLVIKDNYSPELSPIRNNRTPPPPTPRSQTRNMTFMQSTPNQHDSHTVTAFDIFGEYPLSPILPITRPDQPNGYQDTPVMHTSGRKKNVIIKDENGARLVRPTRSSPPPPPLDINKIFPVTSISEEQKKMKVEDFLQQVIENSIERVRARGMQEIEKLQAASDEIKSTLKFNLKE